MKTLLYITNYDGNKKIDHINSILSEFDRMHFLNISVIIYTTENLILDTYQNFDINIEVKPRVFSDSIYAEEWQPEPEFIWLHRYDLSNRINGYELFIHLEDDILFTEDNVKMFLEYANDKFKSYIVGHVLYEENEKQTILPQFHMQYCDIGEIITVNDEDFFVMKNNHQASWIATKEQLKLLIRNDYMQAKAKLSEPYNIKCSAVSEIYSTDLLKKIIPVERFESSLIKHLSNKYIELNEDPSSGWFKAFQTKEEIKQQIETESKLKNIIELKEQFFKLNVNQNTTTEKNQNQPRKVSAKAIIAVPLYNEEKYIYETLNCLHKVANDIDVKFFISDNKSTDRTYEIVKSFAEKDSRFIIYQHEKNIGTVGNFKYLYENSTSQYFMWLGGHDQIDPTYIKTALTTFDKNDDAAYVAAMPYAFYEDTNSAVLIKEAIYTFSDDRLQRYIESVAALSNCTIVNSMFRRCFLEGFEFKATIGYDHVLISRLLLHGKIYYTEQDRYLRRYFREKRGATEERITGNKNVSLDYFSLIEYYVEDFIKLYNQPGEIQSYLCQKMLAILESRFGIQNLDHNKQFINVAHNTDTCSVH
ncbi:MAG: glycosyltransferase family 2 protein [Gammaproteobacteria bacterium]